MLASVSHSMHRAQPRFTAGRGHQSVHERKGDGRGAWRESIVGGVSATEVPRPPTSSPSPRGTAPSLRLVTLRRTQCELVQRKVNQPRQLTPSNRAWCTGAIDAEIVATRCSLSLSAAASGSSGDGHCEATASVSVWATTAAHRRARSVAPAESSSICLGIALAVTAPVEPDRARTCYTRCRTQAPPRAHSDGPSLVAMTAVHHRI